MRHLKYILLLFISLNLCAQKIDSLAALIKTAKEDTSKIINLNKLAREFYLRGEYNKGLIFGNQALVLAQNLGFKKGIAVSHNLMGVIYDYQGNYPVALKNHFAALRIEEEIKDEQGVSDSYNNIGIIYNEQGNYPLALQNYFAALKIEEQINDKPGVAASYNNIGIVYKEQGNYPLALQNYFLALKIHQANNYKLGMAYSYNNIGEVYQYQGNVSQALQNYFSSLKIREELGEKEGMAASFINIGMAYFKQKKIKEAQNYLNKALQLSKEIGSKDDMEITYENLASLDSVMGNFKTAFHHYKLFIIYRDSLNNEETQRQSLQASMQYEFDKKEIATKAQQDKLDAITAEEKQKQRIIIYAVVGLLLLVAVFALFMYNRFLITKKQKQIIEEQKVLVDKAYEELHEKNKEVIDSIHYAKRIQTALITPEKYIAASLNKLIKK